MTTIAPTTRCVHYVISSHWDREWYYSFQDYRYLLVELLDSVLAAQDAGVLAGPFTTDGQAIMLEDYLETRPQRRGDVRARLHDGRLHAGPWYVLPDQWLVNGESLIRNLRLGRQMVRDLGGRPSDVGFACDLFGHISQLPQILRGFGMPWAVVFRGTNDFAHAHHRWRGADGSQVIAYRFGPAGYSSFANQVRRVRDPQHVFSSADFRQRLETAVAAEAERTRSDPLLLFDGTDHMGIDLNVLGDLAGLGATAGDSAPLPFAVQCSTLDAYFDHWRQTRTADDADLPCWNGELREPGRHPAEVDGQYLIPGTLSSRVWIKQWNAACEDKLCLRAEPLATMAHLLLGTEYPQSFLEHAWKWLLQNHPHDSICGCSIDAVHDAMRYRFQQAEQIADRVAIESLRKLALRSGAVVPQGQMRVTLFHSGVRPLHDVVEIDLEIPADWPQFNEFFGYEPKPSFVLRDEQGRDLPYQRLSQTANCRRPRKRLDQFAAEFRHHRVRVAVALSLPPMGYRTLHLVPQPAPSGGAGIPTRHPATPCLLRSAHTLENEHLIVEVHGDGIVTLTDKASGQSYPNLLLLEDCGDIGDGWYHGIMCNDAVRYSRGSRAQVTRLHDGPLLARLQVKVHFQVPRQQVNLRRSDDAAELVVEHELTLRRGARALEVRTRITNTAGDHRLRVLFPTGASAERYLADAPFDVVERPIALAADNHTFRELEVPTRPQQHFTACGDGRRGLVVLSRGLYESAVLDLPDRPIALTLYRSTQRTVFTNGEAGGQMLGQTLAFHYAVMPFHGEATPCPWFDQARHIALDLLVLHHDALDLPPSASADAADRLPARQSLIAVDPPAVLSSLRCVNGSVEVRVFNPTPQAIKGAIRPAWRYREARLVDLESHPSAEPVQADAERLLASIQPKGFVTFQLT